MKDSVILSLVSVLCKILIVKLFSFVNLAKILFLLCVDDWVINDNNDFDETIQLNESVQMKDEGK